MKKAAVVLACDDNFIAYSSCVARRIHRLASEKFSIIVLSDGVSDENKRAARQLCPQLKFIEAAHLLPDRRLEVGHATRATYLRLRLDDAVDFDRVVYLDSDISVNADITPLLDIAPKHSPVAACYDIPVRFFGSPWPYFNAGVAVYDLKAVRSESLFKAAMEYASTHPDKCPLMDQDALNAVLKGRWQVLDWRWNVLGFYRHRLPDAPYVRHFTGYKPWGPVKAGIERRYVEQWRSDLLDSPWPNRFTHEPWKPGRDWRWLQHRAEDTLKRAFGEGRKAEFSRNFRGFLHQVEDASRNSSLAF